MITVATSAHTLNIAILTTVNQLQERYAKECRII